MQKTRKIFSRLTAAVLAGAMLVSGGAVSMTVSAASAKPVLDTDVTVPSAGNVLIGMEGTYANDIQAALKLVNQYRWEACSNGYPNPVNGKKLTKNDYVPMEWSAGLEYLARIRAAESSQTIAHERTNGSNCFQIQTPGGYSSGGECLAWWSWDLDMTTGVELWYNEKDAYLNQTGGVTGHYTSMISPSNRYVGMGAFGTSTAQYYSTSCAEFSGTNNSETFQFTYGDCVQTLEVPASAVTISSNQSKYLYYGDRKTLQLTASYNGYSGFPVEYAKWSSSAPSVVSIEGNNTAVVKDYGKATLTADLGGKTYTLNVEVKDIVKGDVECDDTIDSSDVFSTLLHVASVGAGVGGTLTDGQLIAADIDGNGTVDSTDVYYLKYYVALNGAGIHSSWDDVLR